MLRRASTEWRRGGRLREGERGGEQPAACPSRVHCSWSVWHTDIGEQTIDLGTWCRILLLLSRASKFQIRLFHSSPPLANGSGRHIPLGRNRMQRGGGAAWKPGNPDQDLRRARRQATRPGVCRPGFDPRKWECFASATPATDTRTCSGRCSSRCTS